MTSRVISSERQRRCPRRGARHAGSCQEIPITERQRPSPEPPDERAPSDLGSADVRPGGRATLNAQLRESGFTWEDLFSLRLFVVAVLVYAVAVALVGTSPPVGGGLGLMVYALLVVTTATPLDCPNCGKKVTLNAEACRHCGRAFVSH